MVKAFRERLEQRFEAQGRRQKRIVDHCRRAYWFGRICGATFNPWQSQIRPRQHTD